MKIYTSYFYQVRHFKPYMLPISTAKWDPKWYHENVNQSHVFWDKHMVLNGLRFEPFAPDDSCSDLCKGPKDCKFAQDRYKSRTSCKFLRAYSKQLDKLKYKAVMGWFEEAVKMFRKYNQDPHIEPIIVLLFHEAPDNPCSERTVVQKWFADHGQDVQELQYPIKDNYG